MTGESQDLVRVSVKELMLLELDVALGGMAYGCKRRFLNAELIQTYRGLSKTWLMLIPYLLPEADDSLKIFEMFSLFVPPDLLDKDYFTISRYLKSLSYLDWEGFSDVVWHESIGEMMVSAIRKHTSWLPGVYLDDPKVRRILENTAIQLEKYVLFDYIQESFWVFLDPFVTYTYLPWRMSHAAGMGKNRARFESVIREDGRISLSRLLEVLPKTNALHYREGLRRLLLERGYSLVLWVEPFGLHDSWVVQHGQVIVSVSEPGEFYHLVKEEVEAMAERSRALSDPSRLGILRIIRHADMDITEVAAYFGLARPTVSEHMKLLREAGLVSGYGAGRSVKHRVDVDKVRELIEDLRGLLEIPPRKLTTKGE